jgi:pimeloyl-ACP methyl ester carboxylesterase
VAVDGRLVRSYTAGGGRPGPELVALPGLGAVGYLARWMSACSSPMTVLDLPGYRYGGAHSCPPRIADIADRCAGWLAATGRRDVVLAGHSTGAQCAVRVAAQCPDRVRFLLLLAPTFLPAARTVGALLRRAVPTLGNEDPRELRYVMPAYLRGGGWPVLQLIRDGMNDEPEVALGSVAVPVGVVTGARDQLAPPDWGQELARIAGGRAAVTPGAHNFCFTHPDELVLACQSLLP